MLFAKPTDKIISESSISGFLRQVVLGKIILVSAFCSTYLPLENHEHLVVRNTPCHRWHCHILGFQQLFILVKSEQEFITILMENLLRNVLIKLLIVTWMSAIFLQFYAFCFLFCFVFVLNYWNFNFDV